MTDNSPNVNISHHFQSQISNANADVVSDCFTWVQLFVLCIRISIFPVYLWSSSCLSFVPPFLTWLSGEAASQGSRVAFLHGDTLHGDGDLRRHLLPLRFRLRTQGVRTLSRRQLWETSCSYYMSRCFFDDSLQDKVYQFTVSAY